ncbi:MAG: hypothetical protein AB7G21_04650 [Dehalococcoidia bacterium]
MTDQPSPSGGRMRIDDIRKAVAYGVRHIDDVDLLEDSPLVRTALIRRRAAASTSLFADGGAVRDVLLEIVAWALERLPEARATERVRRIRATLIGVALEGRSIADIAKEHGRLRESWSRGPWQRAVGIVADEFIRRNTEASSSRRAAPNERSATAPGRLDDAPRDR